MSEIDTCEAGLFRRCEATPTRKCRCCGLFLCCVHHHALIEAEKGDGDYRIAPGETRGRDPKDQAP